MISSKSVPPDLDSPPAQIPLASYRQNYLSISSLGNGSFGTVELAKYRPHNTNLLKVHPSKRGTMLDPLCDCQPNTSNLVAIKTMKKRLGSLNDYTRVKEVKFILSIPSHPCLVQIYEMFIDDVNFQLHITMEPMSQNLYQLMKARKASHFSPITLKSILLQILCAIRHIHRYNYFHRDVKPENILVVPTQHYYGSKDLIPPSRKLDNFVIKLADYGLARHIHNLKPYTAYVSTRWYRLPEILLRQRWYSRPIDVWAFGAVAAEVANFMPLFPGSNELDQIWRILKVMGSPTQTSAAESNASGSCSSLPSRNHGPLGGYWNEAQTLASKLGFVLPAEPGLKIAEVLPNPQHAELGAVVQACLTWDPQSRPTIDYICAMPYFHNSPAAATYTEPARYSVAASPRLERDSMVPIACYDQFRGVSSPPQHPTSVAHLIHSECSNMHAASNAFDDDDDGYEREFMKENSLVSPILEGSEVPRNLAQTIGDPVRLIKESVGALPRAGVYQKVTNIISMYQARNRQEGEPPAKESRLSMKLGYASDASPQCVISGEADESTQGGNDEYSWDTRKENQHAVSVVMPEITRVGEALDEEYSLVGDVSFGSGQEINVN